MSVILYMSLLEIFFLNAAGVFVFQEQEANVVVKFTVTASLAICTMGCLDWLTTLIGISSNRAFEANPFLSGIVSTNLAAFTVIKLAATAMIALSFYLADSNLQKVKNQISLPFKLTNFTLKGACIGVAAFLAITVLNNFVVLAQAL
jgi:hypothetical protein